MLNLRPVFIPGASFIVGAFAMPANITSRKNEIVKEYRKLSASPSCRREQGRLSLEGARLCCDAAESRLKVLSLFYTEEAAEKYGDYLKIIRASSPVEYLISQPVAQCLSETKNQQGVFCVCNLPRENSDIPSFSDGKHYLMLENVQDPANLGTVLRTAEAVGIGGAILTGSCCDVYSPKALRAGMGAAFRLPVFRRENAPETVTCLNKAGFRTLAAVPDRDAVLVTLADFSVPTVAVIGNEGNGLTDETEHACTMRVTIPMKGRAESLNAAASAAILMWEMMREKGGGRP